MTRDDGFLERLRATFVVEALEHLAALGAGLAALARSGAAVDPAVVEPMFREAHSLKGAARSVSRAATEAASHALEGALAALKKGELAPSPELLEAMQRAVDGMAAALEPASGPAGAGEAPLRELGRRVEEAVRGRSGAAPAAAASAPLPPAGAPVPAAPSGTAPGTVRISAARFDALLRQAEEMVAARLLAARRAIELREIAVRLGEWRRECSRFAADVRAAETMRASDPHVERLLDFWAWSHSFFTALGGRVGDLARAASADRHALEAAVDRLREGMREALLLPFSTLLEPFPRLLRELARERGKDAELLIAGADVEIDRRILEEMKDPLIHLVRNCIDHGVETPDARERAGKPRRATVHLAIAHHDRQTVEITVSDDGAGIDPDAVRAAAARAGILPAEAASAIPEEEALALVFESGLSTSPLITSVSGRGLGLAIVREKVERLGGHLVLETRRGAGTTFRITLPVTLARFRGLLVHAGGHAFLLPTANLERAVRVDAGAIATVENRATVQVGGELLAVASLAAALELPGAASGRDDRKVALMVVAAAGQRIALVVDDIAMELEVLLKGLGPQLPRVRNLAGAAVLANGTIVPVLYVPDLLKSAMKAAGAAPQVTAAPAAKGEKTVLVVEDSITARALLRNILEVAGFRVKVAVDGVDALATLRVEGADLVVSDVDMPRMGGFELTAKIRADKRLAELPVVLVTALESREDRERGVEVGANAYIVKSKLDQSTLLDIVRRLV